MRCRGARRPAPRSRRGVPPGVRSSRESRRGTLPTRRPDRRTPCAVTPAPHARLDELDAAEGQLLCVVDEDDLDPIEHGEPGGRGRAPVRPPRGRGRRHRDAHRACRRAPRGTPRRTRRARSRHRARAVRRARGGPRARSRGSCTRRGSVRTSVRKPFVPRMAGPSHCGQRPRPCALVLGVAVEEVLDERSSSPPVSSCGGSASAATRAGAHELEGERGDRPRRRARRRPPDGEREPVAQRRGRLAGRGEHEDRVGVDTALDERRDAGDEGRRLAGAGGSDHHTADSSEAGRRPRAEPRPARSPRRILPSTP